MLETVVYKVYDFSQQIFHALSNKQHLKTFVLFAYRYITDCTCIKGMLAALLTCPKLKDVFIRVRFSNSDVALKTASLISNTFQHMSLENINFIAQSTMQDEAVAALAPAFINTSCVRVDCCEVGCHALKRISDVSLLSSKFKFIKITLEQYGGEDRAFFRALKTARSLKTVVLEGELSVSDSAVGRMLLSGDLVELAHLFGVTTPPIVTKTLHVHIFDTCIEIDFKNKCFISVGFVSCQHKYRRYGISKDERIKVKRMMDSRGMHKLSTSLSSVPVKELNLTAHKIGDVGAKYLREPLGNNLYLEQLIIHNCGIGEDGITSLFAGLAGNNIVTTLDASLNPFGDNGAVKLAEYINRTSLQVLDISTCNIGEHGMVAIATALRANTTLRKLSLYSPEQVITQRSEVALAKALVHNRTLKYIQVNQNLRYHYSPFYMDKNLRTFNITLKATLALLEEYSSSELYNSVKMSSTVSSIAVDFASPLGRVLLSGDMSTAANILLLHQPPFGKGKISLHMLDNTWSVNYDRKCVTEQDKGLIFIRGIQRNPWNQFSYSLMGRLVVGLIYLQSTESSGQQLMKLYLKKQKLGFVGASVLANLLNQIQLWELNVACCGIGEEGIILLALALSTNTTIKHLAIGGNEFTMSSQEFMVGALSKNTTLTSLDVRTGRTIPPYMWRLSLADEEDFIEKIDKHSSVTKLYIDGTTPLGEYYEEKYLSDQDKRTIMMYPGVSNPNTIECQLKPFKVIRIYNEDHPVYRSFSIEVVELMQTD